jgi:hypothetical protein
VVEACNKAGGYRVVANHRALASGERAVIRYGDQVVELAGAGESVLRVSSMAQIRTVEYRVEDARLDAPLMLTL